MVFITDCFVLATPVRAMLPREEGRRRRVKSGKKKEKSGRKTKAVEEK